MYDAKVNAHEVIAHVDNGASNLFISRVNAQRLGLEIRATRTETITLGDGSKVPPLGTTEAEFSIEGPPRRETIYVLETAEEDSNRDDDEAVITVGRSWLRANNCIIDCAQDSLTIRNPKGKSKTIFSKNYVKQRSVSIKFISLKRL